jgi:Putative Ig domain
MMARAVATAAVASRVSFVLLVATLGLASCGGDQADLASSTTSTAAPGVSGSTGDANRPPSILGLPQRSLAYGRGYAFTPTASDPEGQRLSFSILNIPRWASFNAVTGSLSGTPGLGDIGTYSNIRISVSDGMHIVSLPPFSIDVVGTAVGSITVNWYAPTERIDGSLLRGLSGYKIYWGTTRGSYPNSVKIDNAGIASYVIEQLTPGTYYVVATAFDLAGVESEFSNVLSAAVR